MECVYFKFGLAKSSMHPFRQTSNGHAHIRTDYKCADICCSLCLLDARTLQSNWNDTPPNNLLVIFYWSKKAAFSCHKLQTVQFIFWGFFSVFSTNI